MSPKKSLILFTSVEHLDTAKIIFAELLLATNSVLMSSTIQLGWTVVSNDTNIVIYGPGDNIYLHFVARTCITAGLNVIYIWTNEDPNIKGVHEIQRVVGHHDDLPIRWVREVIPLLKPLN